MPIRLSIAAAMLSTLASANAPGQAVQPARATSRPTTVAVAAPDDAQIAAAVDAFVFGTKAASAAARPIVLRAGPAAVPALCAAIADPRTREKYRRDALEETPILRLRDAITATTPAEIAGPLAAEFDRIARTPDAIPDWVRNKAIECVARCGGPAGVAILRDVYVDRRPVYSNFPDVAYELRRASRAGRLTADERAAAFDVLAGPKGFRGDTFRDYYELLAEFDRERLVALARGPDWFRADSPRLGDAALLLERLDVPPPDDVAAVYEATLGRTRKADIGTPDWHLRATLLVLLVRAKHPDAERHVELALADHPTQRRPNGYPLGLYASSPGIRAFEALHGVAVETTRASDLRRRGVAVPAAALDCDRVFELFLDVHLPDLGRVFAERDGAEMDACVAALRAIHAAASADALQSAIDAVGPGGRAADGDARVQAVRAVWPRLKAANALLQNPPEDLPVLVARYKAAHAEEIRAFGRLLEQAERRTR